MVSVKQRVLGIDLGGTRIKIGVFDGDGASTLREVRYSGAATDLDAIRDEVVRARSETGDDGGFAGVGVAVPGVIDPTSGRMLRAHDKYAWARDTDLAEWASSTFGAPAIVENDARAALIGESASMDARDIVLMTLGTGIGTAAMMDGTVVRGASGHAGILGGHVTVDLGGPECGCGNVGCAETRASTWALPAVIRAHPDFADDARWQSLLAERAPGIEDVFTAGADDPIARDIARSFIDTWATVVVDLCHAYDPTDVIVTGGVMRSAERIMPALRAHVESRLWPTQPRPRLHVPAHPESSVLLGLATLARARARARARPRSENPR